MNTATLPVVRDESNNFYVVMGLLTIAIVFTAFIERYYARSLFEVGPLPVHVHVHAVLFTTWLLLFVSQARLARRGLLTDHRKVGTIGSVLALLMVIVGVYSAIAGARNGHNPGGAFPNALAFMAVSMGDITLFGAFVAAAVWFRHRAEWHKRFMLFATLGGFLWPSITRLPFVMGRFPLLLVMLAAVVFLPAVHALITRRRVHPLDVACPIIIVLSIPLRRVIGMSDGWQHLAAALVG
jgi:hypothetical protein